MLLCPACFERLSDEGTLASTRVHFRDHARQATSLAIMGLTIFVAGVVTGPAAVGYALYAHRHANAIGEPASDWRLGWVCLLGVVQFFGSLWLVRTMVNAG